MHRFEPGDRIRVVAVRASLGASVGDTATVRQVDHNGHLRVHWDSYDHSLGQRCFNGLYPDQFELEANPW